MTPEQIEHHRKRFEEYYAGDIKLERKGNGNYIYMQAHIAWNTWIAAIESIEIELPVSWFETFSVEVLSAPETRKSIQSLGLKVKER